MRGVLGLPLSEALKSLPPGQNPPIILETQAPAGPGQPARLGTPRVVACREGAWIVARFLDSTPREKEVE